MADVKPIAAMNEMTEGMKRATEKMKRATESLVETYPEMVRAAMILKRSLMQGDPRPWVTGSDVPL